MAEKETKRDPEADTMVWFDKFDGKEYRISFEHAKILYLVSHYARSSRSEEQPETWMHEMSLDVLLFQGITAGKMDFDYAPMSRLYMYANDQGEIKVRRCFLNISQEGRSALDDLIEQEFVKCLKVPNDDNMTTSAYQASQKGMDLLQALPPILRLEVDDFLYMRKGYKERVHPKKDLLNVLTDEDGFILVTENGYEERSTVSQIEDVSYVTSPFLPWTYRFGEHPTTDNSTRAWESGVGISQVKRELKEAITFSQVNILIQEWVPTAANEFCLLLDRFGVKTRNAGGRFTNTIDRTPNNQHVYTKQGLTRVELLDYNSSQSVNFEAEIQLPEDEGVKQVEFIGIHLHTMGAISCGFRVEAIQNRLADDVSCDLMSRMMVDVIMDTSVMLGDLLTASQRRAVDTIHRGNMMSRKKFILIFCDKASPLMKAEQYKDRGEFENELRQVLGEIRIAKSLGASGAELVITGNDGMLIIGRSLRKYDRITVAYGELMGIQSFMKSYFGRLMLLSGEIVRLTGLIEHGQEDPDHFETVRHLRNSVSIDLAVMEEIEMYLHEALGACSIPSLPLEDVGKALFELVDIQGLIQSLNNQLHDIRKLINGCRQSVVRLGKGIRILQTTKERTVGLNVQQNTARMVEVSNATRRTTAVYGFLYVILGCSFGLLMLDAFISARAKYFGMKQESLDPSAADGASSASFSIDFNAVSSVDVSDPTAAGEGQPPYKTYFPMQAALVFDQAPLIGTFASHLLFMGFFLYLMRKFQGFFDTSGTRTVRCRFCKKINPRRMEEYVHSKRFGRTLSTHIEFGHNRCEKIIRFIPKAPFPWTWHGAAPCIEVRVDLEKGLLVSAVFRRSESLPFWKWLLYNQILRRSQKMSMLSHPDEHLIDRFLKNLEEEDVFTPWVPEEPEMIWTGPRTGHSVHIQEIAVDEAGNPLDILETMTEHPRAGAKLEAIDVEYEWEQEDHGTSHDPSRATTAHRSSVHDSAPPGDEKDQAGGQQDGGAKQKEEKIVGFSSLFRKRK